MPKPVLVIEDDPDIAESLRYSLEIKGIETRVARSGEEGVFAALDRNNPPALILLDLLLPGMSGIEICRRLRREPSTLLTPIIMLTAKASPADITSGLRAGADDYITKPFSIRNVMARIDALLPRINTVKPRIYDDGKIRFDFSEMRVFCEGVPTRLSSCEFVLLKELVAQPGTISERQQLIDSLWVAGHYLDSRTLDVHIERLHSILDRSGDVIETIAGVGYRFLGAGAGPNGDRATEHDTRL